MISKKINEAINKQINLELASSYDYLAMAAYLENINLSGSASWMKSQADEEREHAMKLYAHVNDRGGRVVFEKLDAPRADYKSVLEVFEIAQKQEKKVSDAIHKLYSIALKEDDYPAQIMLHWFITEQVEEEKTITEVVERLKMIKSGDGTLLVFDQYLGNRGK